MVNFAVGPSAGKPYPSRVKDIFSDCEFGENNIILGNVANDFLVSELYVSWLQESKLRDILLGNLASDAIDLCNPTRIGLLPHENIYKSSFTMSVYVLNCFHPRRNSHFPAPEAPITPQSEPA